MVKKTYKVTESKPKRRKLTEKRSASVHKPASNVSDTLPPPKPKKRK